MRQSLPKLAKNAFEVLSNLPKHGVGTKITRSTWQDNSFWTVTRVKTELDGKRGKAYGVLTWRGEQQGDEPCRIRGASKKLWKPLSSSSNTATIIAAAAAEVGEMLSTSGAWPSLAASALESLETDSAAAAATEEQQPEQSSIEEEQGDEKED